MKRILIIFILAGGAALGYKAFHDHQSAQANKTAPPVTTPKVSPDKKWSPEEIAKDPAGYLVWSESQIQLQIAERERRLNTLSSTRSNVVGRQQQLVDKMNEVVNFRNRLQTAYQRAEDEDRWPVRMAGKTFERAKVNEILAQTQSWLDDRQPLASAYETSLKKMDDSASALQDDLRNLAQLREKLALDLERVKLNQGMAELDQLRKTETQLASMSAALSKMSEDQAPTLPTASKSSKVDIDSILK